MMRTTRWLAPAVLALSVTAAFAHAAGIQDKGAPGMQAPTRVPPGTWTEVRPNVPTEVRNQLDVIKERGAKATPGARAKAEARFAASSHRVNEAARMRSDAAVVASMATEFRTTADQLQAEMSATRATWGDLTIAYTLQANARAPVTARHLVELNQEGTGWGQIAAGLGFHLTEAVRAVETECRVMAGLSRVDGRIAVIRGPDARVGFDGHVNPGATAAGLDITAESAGIRFRP